VDAVLFDYGGTLVDIDRPVAAIDAAHAAVVRVIAEAGQPPPTGAELTALVHDRVEAAVSAHEASGALEEIDAGALEAAAFADLGLDLDAGVRERCSILIQEAWWQGVRLHPEVSAVLRTLRQRGLRLGICSNAPYRPASMHGQLRHVGLDELIDAAVFSGEVGWRKPSPHLFSAALDAVGATAVRTVFVGDRVREDVDGALAAGMRTVLVVRNGWSPPGSPRAGAVVGSLTEVPGLIAQTRL
jgi:putative hydrolase of the HAD superfamily